jgi:hypothetical protein
MVGIISISCTSHPGVSSTIPLPLANSFIIGTAVINTKANQRQFSQLLGPKVPRLDPYNWNRKHGIWSSITSA